MNASETTQVLKQRLGESLDCFAVTQCEPGGSPPAGNKASPSNQARKTIQTRRTLHGEKTVSMQSLTALQNYAKERKAAQPPK